MSENTDYIVSARKYRPATFRSVVGQKNLTATLKNAISSQRLAQAYLFCGPRGVGKTSCARIFARTINCLNPTPDGEACGECASCRAINAGNSFNLIELDAASNNSVDDIRSITEQVQVPPQQGRYKVFIIDEVHMLTTAAFNAFLKTLEEPPKYAIFILATTEKHKVIPTILSRCQIYDFKRITVADMVEHLAYVAESENIPAEKEALGVIARKADGAMRDALSIFDQVAASSHGNITYRDTVENLNVLDYEYYFRLTEAFRAGDIPAALLIYKEIRDKGFDSLFFVNGLAAHLRDLMVAASPATAPLLELADDVARRFVEVAQSLPVQWYYAALKILNDTDQQYRTASSKQLLVEISLIRLCQLLKPATPPFDAADYIPPICDPAAPARPQSAPAPATPQPASPMPSSPQPTSPKQASPTPSPKAAPKPVKPSAPSSGRPQSFRLSEARTEIRSAAREIRKQPVSAADLASAWQDFIRSNPDRHILVSAMRNVTPVLCGENEFLVTVEHPAQQQAFESAMPALVGYLRERLSNDMLSLRVDIDTTKVVIRNLPPQELLRKVVRENPVIADFLRKIDAELA